MFYYLDYVCSASFANSLYIYKNKYASHIFTYGHYTKISKSKIVSDIFDEVRGEF